MLIIAIAIGGLENLFVGIWVSLVFKKINPVIDLSFPRRRESTLLATMFREIHTAGSQSDIPETRADFVT